MKKITAKEEEVLNYIWQLGRPCSPKEVAELYPSPQPHVNTVSTSFQSLERKGYLTHREAGRGYHYMPTIDREDYGRSKLGKLVKNFFAGSYMSVVNTFVKESRISREELEKLLTDLSKNEK